MTSFDRFLVQGSEYIASFIDSVAKTMGFEFSNSTKRLYSTEDGKLM